jgi:hypothetical protein
MEYWLNDAVARVAGRKKLHFPFAEEWKDLKTSPNYPPLEKAFPDLVDFIWKDIQPCRDTNLHLWAATSLCNFNKHNDFVPITTVTSFENFYVRVGTNVIKTAEIGWQADGPMTLVRSTQGPIAMEQNFQVTTDITFPKGAVFEDQPVIPTLLQMLRVVSKAVEALDKFLKPNL